MQILPYFKFSSSNYADRWILLLVIFLAVPDQLQLPNSLFPLHNCKNHLFWVQGLPTCHPPITRKHAIGYDGNCIRLSVNESGIIQNRQFLMLLPSNSCSTNNLVIALSSLWHKSLKFSSFRDVRNQTPLAFPPHHLICRNRNALTTICLPTTLNSEFVDPVTQLRPISHWQSPTSRSFCDNGFLLDQHQTLPVDGTCSVHRYNSDCHPLAPL